MNFPYETNQAWKQVANRVVEAQQRVLVIGASDVGKSTFCRFLVDVARGKGFKVGFVDTDIGQSQIGPPATIGLKFLEPKNGDNDAADGLYFVGVISPRRNHLEMITGARLMVDSAQETSCDFIVIDTTGYVHNIAAAVLKQQKIERLRPHHLICIGSASELERIIARYSQLDWLTIHRLLPHKRARTKSRGARRHYRRTKFSAYFSGSTVQKMPFQQISGGRTPFFIGRFANEKELKLLTRFAEMEIHHAEWGHRALFLITTEPISQLAVNRIKNHLSLIHVTSEIESHFNHALVGLLGAAGETLAIGIIETIDFQKRQISIRCKAGVAKTARTLQFGDYRIDRELLTHLQNV